MENNNGKRSVIMQPYEYRSFDGINWVDSINEIGEMIGGSSNLVEISKQSLCEDRGNDAELCINESLGILINALNEEAQLTAVGRFMARVELLRSVRGYRYLNRMAENRWNPVDDIATYFIIGGLRSGTSLLLRTLAESQYFRAPYTWELIHPEYIGDERRDKARLIESVTMQDRLWDLVNPEFTRQHLNRGDLPAECLPIMNCGFQSMHWTGCYEVPSYRKHLKSVGFRDAYRIHSIFRSLLVKGSDSQAMLFKAPAHAISLADLLTRYPHARFIYILRSPLDVLSSYKRLISSLRLMRTKEANNKLLDNDCEADVVDSIRPIIDLVSSGVLNRTNFFAIRYSTLSGNLKTSVASIEEWAMVPQKYRSTCRLGKLNPETRAPQNLTQPSVSNSSLVTLHLELDSLLQQKGLLRC
ncbi:MAG: sulfotransferase [Candidatus Thiodiazotropha endolucinida]